jgi:sortase A
MRDKRPVEELSIEELERVLIIRRREARQQRLERMKASGRVVEAPDGSNPPPVSPSFAPVPEPPSVAAIPAATITLDALDAILERKEAPPQFEEITIPASAAVKDEIVPVADASPRPASRFLNRVLLLVEVAAVFGLVLLGSALYLETVDLQRESAEAQRLADEQRRAGIPTLAPTSVIQVVTLEDFVLPGGHVIDSDGNVSFNMGEFIDEVPAQYREQIVRQALSFDLTRPVTTSETALQVFIPSINVDAVIVQGTDWEALKLGVGQVQNGASPAAADGNVALAAHNDIYGALFEDIPNLAAGDLIQVQTATQTFNYRVTETDIVDPTDVNVLENRGKPMVTLITCYPPGVNNKRYIVYAEREDSFEIRS